MAEPLELLAGTTVAWSQAAPVSADGAVTYRASDGWALAYVLLGPAKVEITASADGDDFAVSVAASVSALWDVGWYEWSAFASKGTERYLVGTGRLEVLADPAEGTTADARSHAVKMLAAIEAVLEGRATADIEEYTAPNGLALKKIPVADLLQLRDRYRAELAAEARRERRSRGEAAGTLVRMANLGKRF